jgi:hypothetical protein
MLTSLTLTAVFGIAYLAVDASTDLREAFDEQTLRANAAALAANQREMFSKEELHALRAAVPTASVVKIDGILERTAQIKVTINPEGRVTAYRTMVQIPEIHCGTASNWLVRISNSGYVTAPLSVRVKNGPLNPAMVPDAAAAFSLPNTKLTGARVEYQVMHLAFDQPTQVDATLVFAVGPATSDLGSRAEVPVLIKCVRSPPG